MHHLRNERGSVAGEYAVLLAMVSIALLTIVIGLRGGVINAFQAAINILP